MTKDIPHIDFDKLPINAEVVAETENNLWSLTVVDKDFAVADEKVLLVSVTGTDPRLKKAGGPVRCGLLGSRSPETGSFISRMLVKGWVFELKFGNKQLQTTPVKWARIYTPNWSYEVFS